MMLEHMPAWLGHLLDGVRAGADKLAIADPDLGSGYAAIALSSPAFADGGRLPARFTGDGTGVSPPLTWGTLPAGTRALILLVEDADAPMPAPIVHVVAWGIDLDAGRLEEGALVEAAEDGDAPPASAAPVMRLGHNSFRRIGWLPPDPPTGHGEHRYVFQLFALDHDPDPGDSPGRTAALAAIRGHVLGAAVLTGIYSRGEEAPIPDAAASAIAAT